MIKLKTILLVLLIIVGMLSISSCGSADVYRADEYKTSPPFEVVSVTFEGHSNRVLQKILYNTETKVTYIYDYSWRPIDGVWTAVDKTCTVYYPDETVESSDLVDCTP